MHIRHPWLRVSLVVALLGAGLWSAERSAGSTEEEEPAASPWQILEPGLELGTFVSPRRSVMGDSVIHVLRVDPAHHDLVLKMAGAEDPVVTRTASQWADRAGLLAAINSSMYQQDHETSTELMRSSDHVNNPRLTSGNTVLAFERADGAPDDMPRVRIIDRQCEDLDALEPHYQSLVQSIRMVSCERANVWQQSARIWSHAVIGIDGDGRPLLIHARSPWTTHDFIDILLELPIDLRQLQYAEGGPEAQLFVDAGGVELERFGSFETGFLENDDNALAWPVPNVIGVVRRPGVGSDTDEIAASIRRLAPRFRRCWEDALKADREMNAKLSVSFVIGTEGRVTEVTFQYGDETTAGLEACLDEVLKDAPFPIPPGGGTTEVSYPFNVDPTF